MYTIQCARCSVGREKKPDSCGDEFQARSLLPLLFLLLHDEHTHVHTHTYMQSGAQRLHAHVRTHAHTLSSRRMHWYTDWRGEGVRFAGSWITISDNDGGKFNHH